jgi:hypothetical protein
MHFKLFFNQVKSELQLIQIIEQNNWKMILMLFRQI